MATLASVQGLLVLVLLRCGSAFGAVPKHDVGIDSHSGFIRTEQASMKKSSEPHSMGQFINGNFEAAAAAGGDFLYNNNPKGWVGSGSIEIFSCHPAWGGSPTACTSGGNYFIGLQGQGSNVAQALTSVPGAMYTVQFLAKYRNMDQQVFPSGSIAPSNVRVRGGNDAALVCTLGYLFWSTCTYSFAATGTSTTVTISNDGVNAVTPTCFSSTVKYLCDITTFIDEVKITLINSPLYSNGFENGNIPVAPNSYLYRVPPGWVASDSTNTSDICIVVIATNSMAWGNVQAVEGSRFVGLQGAGCTFTQIFSTTPTYHYIVQFHAQQNPIMGQTSLCISVNGIQIKRFAMPTSWSMLSFQFQAPANDISVGFANCGGSISSLTMSAVFLDKIQMQVGKAGWQPDNFGNLPIQTISELALSSTNSCAGNAISGVSYGNLSAIIGLDYYAIGPQCQPKLTVGNASTFWGKPITISFYAAHYSLSSQTYSSCLGVEISNYYTILGGSGNLFNQSFTTTIGFLRSEIQIPESMFSAATVKFWSCGASTDTILVDAVNVI